MSTRRLKLLYLGFAFPPGVQALFPGVNPAGHMLETNLVGELKRAFEVRSVGLLPSKPPAVVSPAASAGIAHELLLVEQWPEVWHRALSLRALKRQYRGWAGEEKWEPDVVFVYNLSPVYNKFLRWLHTQRLRPKLVLLLLDSPNLGERLPALKRLRRRLKPMYFPDSEMLPIFDACVGLSKAVEPYFQPRGVPFLWMPGACLPQRAIRNRESAENAASGPIRFGYYGALGAHAGVLRMAQVFLQQSLEATLEICGYGKAADELAALSKAHPRLVFRGLLSPDECLAFGRRCDVLVNPRPATHGNENNFASKVFDYALTGRAILTSRLSGVEEVLGPDAYYFEATDFEAGLGKVFQELSSTPREEVHRRGAAVQDRVLSKYSWEEQGRRAAAFLERTTRTT